MGIATLTAVLLAAMPPLSVELSGELPCELGARLLPALAEQQLSVTAGAAHRLNVSVRGAQLDVRLLDSTGHELGARAWAPGANDCAVLPRTVALLTRSWLAARFPVGRADAGTPPAPTGVDAGTPLSTPRAAPPTPELPPPPAPTPEISRPPAPVTPRAREPVMLAPPPLDEADAGAVIAPTVEDAGAGLSTPADAGTPDAGPAANPMTFTVAALGGVTLGLHQETAAQAALLLDWGFLEPWGVSLEAGLDTPRAVDAPPGRISLQLYQASLAARRTLVSVGASRLAASLGVRVSLLLAAATGFVAEDRGTLVSPGLFATLDWKQSLYRALFLIVRLGGHARLRAEVVFVPGVDEALVLPVWSFFAQAGLGLTF